MADDPHFIPPVFEDISSDAEPSSVPEPEETIYNDGLTTPYHIETLDDQGGGGHALKLDAADISKFSSSEFVEEGTLLTDVEEYSSRIRVEADKQARVTSHKADMALSLAEEELAYAETIRINAEAEVKKMLEEARAEVNEIKGKASEKGFADGFTTGFEQAKVENQRVTAKVVELFAELQDLRLTLYREYESEMVKQILLIAKKVVHHELSTQPEFVVNLLKGAMHHLDDHGKVRVNVHPEEYDFVMKHQPDLEALLDDEQVLTIKRVKSLSPVGPVIETEFAVVELAMSRQFSEIDERLHHCLAQRIPLFDRHYKSDLEESNKPDSPDTP